MKAAVVGEAGLELRDIPTPEPGPEQVLVRVRAAGLNRAELAVAAGHWHGPASGRGATIGIEWAGDVAAVGSAVRDIKPNDRVMCGGTGGYAEYAVCDYGRVAPIPDGLSYEQAATLPVGLTTMHDALVTNGALHRGHAVLIQGASSGVGLLGLQIAKYLGASFVAGSSTDPARRARLAEFGADLALDSKQDSWPDELLAATDKRGVDLTVDMVAGPTVNGSLRATAILGRMVNVGRLGGADGNFDFDLHAMRRITYVGVTFRTRSIAEVRDIYRRMWADLGEGIRAGAFRLPIDRSFPLDQATEAQAHMRANRHFGKIVLTMP
jgi:NADPH:quinone reductase